MINSSREEDFQAKQENSTNDSSKLLQPTTNTTSTTTSRQWAGFKNPRIVRVSRTFGGKDRHSKVCTVRGLRDRRIRLSVPTAIQLYDLQDRLGLSQPSKVVDWLLDVTKDEIDKLPPLQMPSGNLAQYFNQPNLIDRHQNESQSSHVSHFFNMNNSNVGTQPLFHHDGGIKINDQDDEQQNLQVTGKLKNWNVDLGSSSKGKCKEVETEAIDMNKWMMSSNEQERNYMAQLSAQNFFPVGNQSFPSLQFNPYNHWEPSNLSLSQFGTQLGFQSQTDPQNSAHHFVSPLALPSPSQSLLLTPTIFPQYSVDQTDPRQFNHFQHIFQNSLVPNLQLISPPHVYPKVNANNGEGQQDKSEGSS